MQKLLLTLMISLSATFTFSQIAVGAKGGLNVNSLPYRTDLSGGTSNFKSAVGWHLGLFSQLNISGKFSLIPEIMFIHRDVGIKNGSSDRLNLSYVELPVYLSYTPVKFIQVDAGPSFSAQTSAKFVSGSHRNNASDLFDKKFIFGVAGGVRINLTEKLSAMLHVYQGLTPVANVTFRDANNMPAGEVKFHSFNTQLSVGYKFFKL